MEELKACTKCGQVKPLEDYSKDKRKPDGRFGACKECEKIRRNKWEVENAERVKFTRHVYNEIHCDEIKKYNDNYYLKNRNSIIQYHRNYNKEKSQEISEKKKVYYNKNRIQILKRCKKWAKENPEKATQKTMRREALKRNNTVGKVDYSEILKRDNYVCHICGCSVNPDDVHFDHIIPLSKGGEHSMNNIAIAHSHCNMVKHNKILQSNTRRL